MYTNADELTRRLRNSVERYPLHPSRSAGRRLQRRAVIQTPLDDLLHAADMMTITANATSRINPQQNASSGNNETTTRAIHSILKRFKMLRSASKCSVLRPASSTIHWATTTTLVTTQRVRQAKLAKNRRC